MITTIELSATRELSSTRFPRERCESIISSVPGASDHERILIVLCQTSEAESRLEMRQQSWSAGIGWFTQNTIHLATDQVNELRYGLAAAAQSADAADRKSARQGNKKARQKRAFAGNSALRVLHADSA